MLRVDERDDGVDRMAGKEMGLEHAQEMAAHERARAAFTPENFFSLRPSFTTARRSGSPKARWRGIRL
jgi:hypothetical protein